MTTGSNATKKKRPVLRIVILSLIIILVIAGIFLYTNFNRLLSDALLRSYNSTLIADVYELKFEKLRVNIFEGTIRVFKVSLMPREKPLKDYPYINSSFKLTTEKITLKNVEIRTLLQSSKLILNRISITKPNIEVLLTSERNIMVPFKDTTATTESVKQKTKKKALGGFMLKEFELIEAAFHTTNSHKQREFFINDFNIAIHNLQLSQQPGEYFAAFDHVTLAIGKLNGHMQKSAFKQLDFKDFKIGIDTLDMQLTLDTITFHFHDFNTEVHNLDIQTRDSIFHIAMKSFDLSYKDQSVKLKEVSFKPNVSHAVIQKEYKYQHTEFSVSVDKLDLKAVNFDSLIYGQKLFVDEIEMEEVKATIFKDKTKPMDSNRFPAYLGQTIRSIKMPLRINKVKAKKVALENTERKPDSTQAMVKINQAKLEADNITNLAPKENLVMRANAYINGKVQFYATLAFSYSKPQFSFEGKIDKFNLPDLNSLIQAYTPAKINEGVADEISFKGIAEEKNASGTMKFLYHNLKVDLELQNQAKWKSAAVAFAANTVLNNSNPAADGLPPREVSFHIDRDMNKGFVNVIIKSVLNGLKETMIMNKENRKTHQESKKKSNQEKKNK
jgi:hypothetical protein